MRGRVLREENLKVLGEGAEGLKEGARGGSKGSKEGAGEKVLITLRRSTLFVLHGDGVFVFLNQVTFST